MESKPKKLRPVLDGEYWMIGDNPDLGDIQGLREHKAHAAGRDPQEPVDHHVFQANDETWHLWGCIRGTAVERVLYHWQSDNLEKDHWAQTGDVIRANRDAGESINDWRTQEWMQSPFAIREKDRWYMFYGGHGTGETESGVRAWATGGETNPSMDCQICLMTSDNGRDWKRYANAKGQSRVFIGPGEARDPCLLKIDGLWHLYYAGFHANNQTKPGFYVRTSQDLLNWSRWQLVHCDRSGRYGAGNWDCECPHVVYRAGYYYLFRTENYETAKAHVFRSKDPMNFGIDDAKSKYVGPIDAAAPEIAVDTASGQEYISSNHDLDGGTRMCRLKWIED